MTTGRAAICAALFMLIASTPVLAEDVTLKARDGQIEVTGTLLGFDGEFYRVETIYGELTVDGSGVICTGPGCPNLQAYVAEIDLSGASTIGSAMMPALVEAFAVQKGLQVERAAHDDGHMTLVLRDDGGTRDVGRLYIRRTTTNEGFADLLANEADLVMAQREIRPEERARAVEAGLGDLTPGNRSRVLALDALVPVVAPDNPVRRIAPRALAQVLAGHIVDWAELGGPSAPISVHLPRSESGLSQAVEDRIMKPAGLDFMTGIIRHDHGDALAAAVLRDPFAIGVASYAEVGKAEPLALTGPCGYELSASRLTIKTEDYPFTVPMFLYLPARRLPKLGREFLAFLRSPTAELVIRRAGFVDQAPETISIASQGQRISNAILSAGDEIPLEELKRMLTALDGKARLTTSFRFEAGSARLDAQSRSNVEQLAQALEAGRYDERTLLFAGFSDGVGPAEANREIALRRAEAVRRAVSEAAETADFDRLQITVDAFGESLPIACDDTGWGQQANRRVEVWVR